MLTVGLEQIQRVRALVDWDPGMSLDGIRPVLFRDF
jgi:hypothetical protein